MKYTVEQTYDDFGNVTVQLTEVQDTIDDVSHEGEECDFYRDVFTTYEEATAFAEECRRA